LSIHIDHAEDQQQYERSDRGREQRPRAPEPVREEDEHDRRTPLAPRRAQVALELVERSLLLLGDLLAADAENATLLCCVRDDIGDPHDEAPVLLGLLRRGLFLDEPDGGADAVRKLLTQLVGPPIEPGSTCGGEETSSPISSPPVAPLRASL
jgi:hypothetical protein